MGTTLRLLRAGLGPLPIRIHRDRARVSVARACRKASQQQQPARPMPPMVTLDMRRLHWQLLPCQRRSGAEGLRLIRTNRPHTMRTTVGASSARRCDERRWAAPAAARTAARAGSGSVSPVAATAAVRRSARASVVVAAVGERVWQRRMEPTAVERGCMGGIIIIIIIGGRRRGMKFRLCRRCRVLRGDDRVCVGLTSRAQ
jgi:hypothetical protein